LKEEIKVQPSSAVSRSMAKNQTDESDEEDIVEQEPAIPKWL
jgi:hypothetical protein